ncbi:hypothetical protein LCGC14_2666300, partial [marine sediment metagenome]
MSFLSLDNLQVLKAVVGCLAVLVMNEFFLLEFATNSKF